MRITLIRIMSWLGLLLGTGPAMAQQAYYFAKSGSFDPAIPTPEQFLGYPIGSHYTRHDRIVDYLRELGRLTGKIQVQVIGKTYEERPLVVATITSPDNQQRLSGIQKSHQQLADPTQALPDLSRLPVLVHLQYSVHGAETSSGEVALLTAYYLTASQSEETAQFLREAVVFIDPSQNPDGRDRAAHWHNMHKSFPPVADPLDREHLEIWPGGGVNHYWNNLNRDWLAAVHVESKAKLQFYNQWLPNVVIDFHEMGTNSTYYFEPSKPIGSENPIIPRATYEVLNVKLAQYHAKALDELGALYWTKEVFDNIAPIYGSTYPDFAGGVGITFEVGSSRGLVQESPTGNVTFASTIRKHLATGIATVRGAVAERELLLKHKRKFFRSALTQARTGSAKGYVFGDTYDINLTQKLLEVLLLHRIQVYELPANATYDGRKFETGKAYVVPAEQPHYRLVHSVFEETTQFADSIFHDVTAWSLIHAYGLPFARIKSGAVPRGAPVTAVKHPEGSVENGPAAYAYLLEWSDYHASKALFALLNAGVVVKAAHKPFAVQTPAGKRSFGYGSLIVSTDLQRISPDSLYRLVLQTARQARVTFTGVSGGLSAEGIDLGSNNVLAVKKPEALLLLGNGINASEAGEVWCLLDEHLRMPVTKIELHHLSRAALSRYNLIILVGGNYNGIGKEEVVRLKNWLREGGTLITFENCFRMGHPPGTGGRKTGEPGQCRPGQ